MKVFLDANILFSASDAGSATHQLLLMILETGCAWTSPHALEEARRNLTNKRPHSLSGLSDIEGRVSLTHAIHARLAVVVEEKDRPILAAAVASGCTHLWTSDRKHFGHLYGMTVQGVLIVSSLQMLDAVEQSG